MNIHGIKAAIKEAERFLDRAKDALNATHDFEWNGKTEKHLNIGRESGALRRASLDLTRALADMRRP